MGLPHSLHLTSPQSHPLLTSAPAWTSEVPLSRSALIAERRRGDSDQLGDLNKSLHEKSQLSERLRCRFVLKIKNTFQCPPIQISFLGMSAQEEQNKISQELMPTPPISEVDHLSTRMTRRRYHSFSPEALNPRNMGAERNGRMQQCQSTKQFMARLYLLWIQPYQPQGLRDCSPRRLCMKKTSLMKAGREMCLCLSGWCHPCMQNCRAQLDCRGEKKRGAQVRRYIYCLQDETARKDKAGIQSSQCCFSLLPLIKAKLLSQSSALLVISSKHTSGSTRAGHGWVLLCHSLSLLWVAPWLHCASVSSLPWLWGGGGWTSGTGKRFQLDSH